MDGCIESLAAAPLTHQNTQGGGRSSARETIGRVAAGAIAKKVLADPALLDKARGNARRWQESHDRPSLALLEWEQILGGSVDQVARFLVARSETATRLRQSSPFTGILTEPERLAVYESYSTRTYHPGSQPNLG